MTPAPTQARPAPVGPVRSRPCPECGGRVVRGYAPLDPFDGDVEPFGYCLSPSCEFEF